MRGEVKSEKPESRPDGDTNLPDRDKLRRLVVKGEEFTGLTQVNHLNGFSALFASYITKETHTPGKRQSFREKRLFGRLTPRSKGRNKLFIVREIKIIPTPTLVSRDGGAKKHTTRARQRKVKCVIAQQARECNGV